VAADSQPRRGFGGSASQAEPTAGHVHGSERGSGADDTAIRADGEEDDARGGAAGAGDAGWHLEALEQIGQGLRRGFGGLGERVLNAAAGKPDPLAGITLRSAGMSPGRRARRRGDARECGVRARGAQEAGGAAREGAKEEAAEAEEAEEAEAAEEAAESGLESPASPSKVAARARVEAVAKGDVLLAQLSAEDKRLLWRHRRSIPSRRCRRMRCVPRPVS